MNILKKEIKFGCKTFLFWSLALFVLDIAGLIKFTGVSEGGASMSAIIDKIPRVVQALIGIVGINIETLSGYYAILAYFVLMCSCIYAIYLAATAMNRETIDKTVEFIFTKPRSRSYIITIKLLTGLIYLTLFAILNYLFTIIGLSVLNFQDSIAQEMILATVSTYLISLVYYAVTASLSAIFHRPEKGSFYGNIFFLITFVFGVIVDMLENPGLLRILSPIKYFPSTTIINGEFSIFYSIISIGIILVCLSLTYHYFNLKDL